VIRSLICPNVPRFRIRLETRSSMDWYGRPRTMAFPIRPAKRSNSSEDAMLMSKSWGPGASATAVLSTVSAGAACATRSGDGGGAALAGAVGVEGPVGMVRAATTACAPGAEGCDCADTVVCDGLEAADVVRAEVESPP